MARKKNNPSSREIQNPGKTKTKPFCIIEPDKRKTKPNPSEERTRHKKNQTKPF
jgi:hypothetical protein